MIVLRIILIPLSVLYSLIISLRNLLFDNGILKSHKISKPVLSVGNISTGGTGKTPLTILISRYYLEKGKRIGIVSRGYKRKSAELILVSDGNTINENINQSGDELILMANELIKNYKGKFFIAAGSNRVEASEYLITKFNPDVIILDDAFQHRNIQRDLDIVIVNADSYLNETFLNTFTLPSGILREGYFNLNRAGIIIQNNKNSEHTIIPDLTRFRKPIFQMRYKTEYFMDYKNCILNDTQKSAILFSGIADDKSFVNMVKAKGFKILNILKYPDHHNYDDKNINDLISKFAANSIFITTEKDFVKVKQFTDFVKFYPVYFMKIKAEIEDNKETFSNKLESIIQ